jgi:hypothetical protein
LISYNNELLTSTKQNIKARLQNKEQTQDGSDFSELAEDNLLQRLYIIALKPP